MPAPTTILDDGTTTLRGPTTGGTPATVIGGSDGEVEFMYADTSCDDSFDGVVVDAGKWTTSTAGSGSVAQDDEIILRTGAGASGSATLTSVPTFGPIQEFLVGFRIDTDVVAMQPGGSVSFLDLELQFNASNYFRCSRDYSTAAGHRLTLRMVQSGITSQVSLVNTSRAGTFRLVRVNNRVAVYLNALLVYDGPAMPNAAGATFIARASSSTPYDCTTAIDNFVVSPLVVFGREPAQIARGDEGYVRVISPPSAVPRVVDIEVYTCSGRTAYTQSAFEYVIGEQFVVLSSSGVTVGVVDETLRNGVENRVGFGA